MLSHTSSRYSSIQRWEAPSSKIKHLSIHKGPTMESQMQSKACCPHPWSPNCKLFLIYKKRQVLQTRLTSMSCAWGIGCLSGCFSKLTLDSLCKDVNYHPSSYTDNQWIMRWVGFHTRAWKCDGLNDDQGPGTAWPWYIHRSNAYKMLYLGEGKREWWYSDTMLSDGSFIHRVRHHAVGGHF